MAPETLIPAPRLLPPVYLLAGGPGSRRKGPDPLLQAVFALPGRPSPSKRMWSALCRLCNPRHDQRNASIE
jgi:hypothetical protein